MTMELRSVEQAEHQPVPFDYAALPANDAKLASEAAESIKTSGKRMAGYALAIGQKLAAVKDVLDHGQFGAWIEAEFSWNIRTAQNYMAAWTAFGDKSETVSHLPPTTIYALAAPSTPEPVRKQVVDRLEAGERVQPREVTGMIRDARERAKMAAIEAKITDKERGQHRRAVLRRKRREEQTSRDIERERQEREQREREADAAAEQAVAFLKERLGDDLPAFIELAKAAGMAKIGQRLGVTVFVDL